MGEIRNCWILKYSTSGVPIARKTLVIRHVGDHAIDFQGLSGICVV
jgi:hypothetical protein